MQKLLNKITTDRIKHPRHEAHKRRASDINTFILSMIAIIFLLYACGCTPKHGCNGTRGMSGYGWIKCRETQKVFILDSNCNVICAFKDGSNLFHSNQ